MSWSEAKKISDVVIDSTRFSEIVVKGVSGDGSSVTINGCGEALCYAYGSATIKIDNAASITLPSVYGSQDYYTWIPFNKQAVITTRATGADSIVYAFLRNNISIGGGYRRKLVPFSIRKAVAA